MYRDNSLIPKEAIRLAALGMLARRPMPYSEVASEVRQFASRIVGPSLDLLGTSIELLKFEGLIAPLDATGDEEDPKLGVTDSGQTALREYLVARLRPGGSDVNRLVLSLKLRFCDLLADADRADLFDSLLEMHDAELARLEDLRDNTDEHDGVMLEWLDLEIRQVRERIDWVNRLSAS